MDFANIEDFRRKARVHYEVGRVRMGLVGALPLAFLVALTTCVAHDWVSTLTIGVFAYGLAVTMIAYGRLPQRAVLPGIAAGVVPLVFAVCANHLHSCADDSCSSLCVPACVVGGVVAGLSIASVGTQLRAGLAFWIPASALTILTGSLGCSCVGYSGVAGLAAGFAAGIVPGLLRRLFEKNLD